MDELITDIYSLIQQIRSNKDGSIVVSLICSFGFDTIYLDTSSNVYVFSKQSHVRKSLHELSEEELYEIACYLHDNYRILQSREVVLEFEDASSKLWAVEPVVIMSGEDAVGMIGVERVEQTEGGELLGIVFISPDKTYATLTMFNKEDEETISLAKLDLQAISTGILQYMNSLSTKFKNDEA